jgi:hypothetical protein
VYSIFLPSLGNIFQGGKWINGSLVSLSFDISSYLKLKSPYFVLEISMPILGDFSILTTNNLFLWSKSSFGTMLLSKVVVKFNPLKATFLRSFGIWTCCLEFLKGLVISPLVSICTQRDQP